MILDSLDLFSRKTQKIKFDFIDIAKGIGILFVIIGHTWYMPASIRELTFSFHMPLFFAVAGITLTDTKISTFLKNKYIRLVVPIFISNILFYLCFKTQIFYENFYQIPSIIYGNFNIPKIFNNSLPTVSAIFWFSFCLFLSTFIFLLLIKLKKKFGFNDLILSIMCIILTLIGYTLTGFGNHHIFPPYNYLPYLLDLALFTQIFILFGYLFKKYIYVKRKVFIISTIVSLILFILTFIFLPRPYNLIGRDVYLITSLRAIFGCVVVFGLSELISNIKYFKEIFIYFGKYSIVVYHFHMFQDDAFQFTPFVNFLLITIRSIVFIEIFRIIPFISSYVFKYTPYDLYEEIKYKKYKY